VLHSCYFGNKFTTLWPRGGTFRVKKLRQFVII
jgi:hypothetical protein